MEGRSLFRIALLVGSVAFTALAYRNSNGDNSEAIALATTAACGGTQCSASLGQQSRGPFSHDYMFRIGRGGSGKQLPAEVFVECKRELALIGDWRCVTKTMPGGN